MGTWKRRPQLPEHRLLNLFGGVVWRPQANVWWSEKEQRIEIISEETHQAPWPCVAKLSILKHMIWGVLPCDIWTALRVHSLGKSDNSWKTTPLPSTLQLCRRGMTLLETLHHACLEKFSVLLSPSCGWAYAGKEKDFLRASNWVSESQDSIVSRGVATCAGMTAHTVILAQTRVGFLTGGRGKKSFLALPEEEQMVQLEQAYARATVAIHT